MKLIRTSILALLTFLFFTGGVFAQSSVSDVHQMTTTPIEARFEIIQSELAAKWTFRLDRYTGNVDQLVKTQADKNAWEKMPIQELPEISDPTKPRFILFTSGIAARHTFLMDSSTGVTWVVTAVKGKISESETITINTWVPFEQ